MLERLAESGLTGAPQFIEWTAVFIGLLIATVVGRLNMMRGKNGTPSSPAMGEIAGAIIDKESAELIVNAIKRQTEASIRAAEESAKNSSAIRANVRAIEMLSARLENNTDAAKAAGAMIDEARQDIRELTRELVRGKG